MQESQSHRGKECPHNYSGMRKAQYMHYFQGYYGDNYAPGKYSNPRGRNISMSGEPTVPISNTSFSGDFQNGGGSFRILNSNFNDLQSFSRKRLTKAFLNPMDYYDNFQEFLDYSLGQYLKDIKHIKSSLNNLGKFQDERKEYYYQFMRNHNLCNANVQEALHFFKKNRSRSNTPEPPSNPSINMSKNHHQFQRHKIILAKNKASPTHQPLPIKYSYSRNNIAFNPNNNRSAQGSRIDFNRNRSSRNFNILKSKDIASKEKSPKVSERRPFVRRTKTADPIQQAEIKKKLRKEFFQKNKRDSSREKSDHEKSNRTFIEHHNKPSLDQFPSLNYSTNCKDCQNVPSLKSKNTISESSKTLEQRSKSTFKLCESKNSLKSRNVDVYNQDTPLEDRISQLKSNNDIPHEPSRHHLSRHHKSQSSTHTGGKAISVVMKLRKRTNSPNIKRIIHSKEASGQVSAKGHTSLSLLQNTGKKIDQDKSYNRMNSDSIEKGDDEGEPNYKLNIKSNKHSRKNKSPNLFSGRKNQIHSRQPLCSNDIKTNSFSMVKEVSPYTQLPYQMEHIPTKIYKVRSSSKKKKLSNADWNLLQNIYPENKNE